MIETLDQRCLTDDDVRNFVDESLPDELLARFEQHFSECDSCFQRLQSLDTLASDTGNEVSETVWLNPTERQQGMTFNEDEGWPQFAELSLKRKIGHGGFGDVFLAEQRTTNNRVVAVKTLRKSSPGHSRRDTLGIEVAALIRIDHENVAKIHQRCVSEDGSIGIVMEYIDGPTLGEAALDSEIAVPDRFRILAKICEALQHVHGKGIVHRDLTPKNILLATKDGVIAPKIIDFGLSILANRLDPRILMRAGTPFYMAPEQSGQIKEEVSERSDIYTVGICAYEFLSGLRAAKYSDAELVQMRDGELPIESSRLSRLQTSPRMAAALSPSKLRELDSVFRKATAAFPGSRYASVKEFSDDIEAVLRERPTSLRSTDIAHRAKLFVKRNRIGIVAGCITICFALIGFIVVLNGEREKQDAILSNAHLSRKLTDDINPLVKPAKSFANDEQSIDTASTVGTELLQHSFRTSDELLTARLNAANTLVALGDSQQATAQFESIVADCEERFGDDADDTIACRMHLARAYLNSGRLAEADRLFKAAHKIWGKRYGNSDSRSVATASYTAEAWRLDGQFESSIELCEKTMSFYKPDQAQPNLIAGQTQQTRGRCLFALGRYEEALAAWEIVTEEFSTQGFSPTHPASLFVQGDIAMAEARLRKCGAATERIDSTLWEMERVYPEGAIAIDRTAINKAVILAICEKFEAASDVLSDIQQNTRHEVIKQLTERELKGIETLRARKATKDVPVAGETTLRQKETL